MDIEEIIQHSENTNINNNNKNSNITITNNNNITITNNHINIIRSNNILRNSSDVILLKDNLRESIYIEREEEEEDSMILEKKKQILRLEEQCLKIILQANYWKENEHKLVKILSNNIQLLIQLHCISGIELIEQWTKIRVRIFKEGAITKKTLFQNIQIANFYWNKKGYEKLKNTRGETIAYIFYKEMKIVERDTKRNFYLRQDLDLECDVGGMKTHPWILYDGDNNHLALLNPTNIEISKKILMQSKPWMKIAERIKEKMVVENPHWQKMYTLDWPLNETHKKRPSIMRKSYQFSFLRAATILLFCTKYFSPFITSNVCIKSFRSKNVLIKFSNLNPAVFLPKYTIYTDLVKILTSQPPPTVSYQARAWHETSVNGNIKQHTVWRHNVNLEGLISPHPPVLRGLSEVQRFCESTNAIRLLIYQKKVDIDFRRIAEKINGIIKPRILELYNVPHFSGGIVLGNQNVRVLPNNTCNKILDNCFVRLLCVLSCLWIIYCPIQYCVEAEYTVIGKYKSDLSFSTIYELFEDELIGPNNSELEYLEKTKKKNLMLRKTKSKNQDEVYLLLNDDPN